MTISAVELAGRLGLPEPTPEQIAVIESGLEPAAVVAGAGSGKTETMAARVVWLIANRHVRPDEVLGLTFTRKAAGEFGTRVRRRLAQWRRVVEHEQPDDTEQLALLHSTEPTVLTYAAYAGRLAAEHALRVGAEPDALLLSPALCWQLADTAVRRWPHDLPQFNAISSLVGWVVDAAGQFADHLVDPADVTRFCADAVDHYFSLPLGPRARSEFPNKTRPYVDALTQRTALVPLVEAFQGLKKVRNGVDYGDQMRLAAQLAGLAEVAAIERTRYRAVLLDEYQDTGHAQIEMLRGLFGDGHPVTAVGDPMQSIYGWRGASSGNMLAYADVFPIEPGRRATVFPLATSFRNDRAILDVANAVAGPLRDADVPTLRPSATADAGTVRASFVETVEDEAAWVAAQLRQEWDALPAEGGRTAAVLVRRRTQMQPIAEALHAVGLPVEIVGLGGLLITPEVVDVVATLRVLADVKSGGAVMRLLTGARWRIGPADLKALQRQAYHLVTRGEAAAPADEREPLNLVEALDDLGPAERYSPDGYARMSVLGAALRRLRRRLTAPLAELVAEIEQQIDVDIEVDARSDRRHVGRIHLDRFLDVAADFAAEAGDASVRAFLAYLEAAEEEEHALEAGEIIVEAERVQLLTVHGAKGLEWDLVAVPGLSSELFPAAPKAISWVAARHELPGPLRGDRAGRPELDLGAAGSRVEVGTLIEQHNQALAERHQAEERRLAYVALTRAKSVLLCSGYAWDTTKKPRTPSPFLTEVGEQVELETLFVPDDTAANPRTVEPTWAGWPQDPLGDRPGVAGRRAAVEEGATLVRAALAQQSTTQLDLFAAGPAEEWRAAVDRLLSERAELAARDTIDVELPRQLSVSQLVELARDPAELAQRLARPLPVPPAPWARRGTAFHTWLDERWASPTLLDIDELPGSADDTASDDADFEQLRAAFEASEWAERRPTYVEVPFDMAIDDASSVGTIIRGRMDAVFGSADDGWQVVDWKTGSRPTGAAARAAALQLAAYRLAWARLNDIPDDQLHTISAAFHYVRSNETVSPANLLDADGLRALLTD